jgi:hypothetical protein
MWDVLQLGNSPIRPLRPEEAELIRLLRYKGSGKELQEELAESLVTDMEDGGMGSIRFVRPQQQTMGAEVIEAQYTDIDGVMVSIALNFDKKGQLFELDFWKVDFSPLKRYPLPFDLVMAR